MILIQYSYVCSVLVSFLSQLEDGHTLFDYDVGLNDIVQLMIRPSFNESKLTSNEATKLTSWNSVQINGTDEKEVMNGDSQCESDGEAMDTDAVGVSCVPRYCRIW